MTGEILRRLREACGLEYKDVAKVLGKSCYGVRKLEDVGKSWGISKTKGYPSLERRQARFFAYLDALRKLCGKPLKKRIFRPGGRAGRPKAPVAAKTVKVAKPVEVGPVGATHQIERQGIKEWARIVPMHGTLRGFAWRDGEWRRAAWVEGSTEFRVALFAARLPLRRRKTVPVQGAINIYHDTLRERGWR